MTILIYDNLHELFDNHYDVVKDFRFYKAIRYDTPIRIHTDKVRISKWRICQFFDNHIFKYGNKDYKINANNYVLFDCTVPHGSSEHEKTPLNCCIFINHDILDIYGDTHEYRLLSKSLDD